MRRLALLVRALPADASVWHEVRAAKEAALTSVERNRERMNHYRRQAQKGAAE